MWAGPNHTGGMELAGASVSGEMHSKFFGILGSILGNLPSLSLVMSRYHLDLVTNLQRHVAQRWFVTSQAQPIALLLDDAHVVILGPHADDARSVIVDIYANRRGSVQLDSILGGNAIQPSLGLDVAVVAAIIIVTNNSRLDGLEQHPFGLKESLDGGRLTRLLDVEALEGPVDLLVAAGRGEAQILQHGAVEKRDDLPR